MVWNGDGQGAPPLPSPGLSVLSQGGETDGEEGNLGFADAQDRLSSDPEDNGDVTTAQSTMSRRRAVVPSPRSHNNNSSNKASASKSAKKKASSSNLSRGEARGGGADEAPFGSYDDASNGGGGGGGGMGAEPGSQGHHHHIRNTSVGSSIWAGRGASKADRFDDADAPPMPMPHHPFAFSSMNAGRSSMADTGSMYSEGPAHLDDDVDDDEDDQGSKFEDSLDDPNSTLGPQPTITTATTGQSIGDLAGLGDDDFEMMPTSSAGPLSPHVAHAKNDATNAQMNRAEDQPRRLADGTVVPKMPPIPARASTRGMTTSGSSSSVASATAPLQVTKRGKKGRLNRSPILSYEEGAEEEERLANELDNNEAAGRLKNSLGPRLKKNTPAPWELEEGEEADDGIGGLPRSNSSSGTSSRDFPWSSFARPSMDRERTASTDTGPRPLPPSKSVGSGSGGERGAGWARQSMESLRGRAFTNKDKEHDPMPAPSPLSGPRKFSGNTSQPQGQSQTQSEIPDESDPVVAAAMAAAEQASSASRRSRSKSISNNAAGVLKGLGLASSAAPPQKKGNKFARAFRLGGGSGSGSGGGAGSGPDKKGPLSLSAGISSEDYAHLPQMPPSPQPQTQQLPAVFSNATASMNASQNNPGNSNNNATITSSSNNNNYSTNGNLMQPSSSPYSMEASSPGALSRSSLGRDGHENVSTPLATSTSQATARTIRQHQPNGGEATERESGSLGSHTGSISNLTNGSTMSSSLGASASSAGTSPIVSPAKKPDLTELLAASNHKYRDQAYVPKGRLTPNGRSPSLGVSSQGSPMQPSSQGASPSQANTPRMPSSLSYKRTSTFAPDGTYLYQQQRGQNSSEWNASSSPPPTWKTMSLLEQQQMSSSTHESQEAKSRSSSRNQPSPTRGTLATVANNPIKNQGLSVSSHEDEARAGSATPTGALGMAAMTPANSSQLSSKQQERRSSETHESANSSSVNSTNTPMTTSTAAAAAAAAGADMKQHPSVGHHGGVPYKLISLEQARLNQSRERLADNQRSFSNHSLDGNNDPNSAPPTSSLKNKKSGFLKIFNKDNRAIEEDPASMPMPLPSMASSMGAKTDEYQGDGLGLVAPALQLRPVSSMFSGFGADLLAPKQEGNDASLQSITEAGGDGEDADGFLGPSKQQQQQQSAPSPAMTTLSVGDRSMSSSQAMYEDAQEMVGPSAGKDISKVNGSSPSALSHRVKAPTAIIAAPYRKGKGQSVSTPSTQSPGFESAQSHAMTEGMIDPGTARQTSDSSANGRYLDSHQQQQQQQRPHSTASDVSDASSSAMGLVNGFPPTPNTSANAAAIFANAGERAAAISSTRNKAIELEAEMARLVTELAQLRQDAVEMGLVNLQQQVAGVPNSPSKTSLHSAAQATTEPPTTVPSPNPSVAAPPSPLQTPVPQCSACGCNCAEQKRIQALNEAAILKGLSVLDRGRALKPSNGANPGKFGGYLNR